MLQSLRNWLYLEAEKYSNPISSIHESLLCVWSIVHKSQAKFCIAVDIKWRGLQGKKLKEVNEWERIVKETFLR